MPPLNLTSITLPDLLDTTKYPEVTHAPSCTDTWSPTRTCFLTPLHHVRPYGLPTVPLATLKFPWARRNFFHIPAVPLIPPSLGTFCAGITATNPPPPLVGDAAEFNVEIKGSKCHPILTPHIIFPCTQLLAGPKEITMERGGLAAEWTQTVEPTPTPTSCITTLIDSLVIPCSAITVAPIAVTGDGKITGALTFSPTVTGCNTAFTGTLELSSSGGGGASGGFFVGTTGSHTTNASDACTTSYPPGSVVPIYDKNGMFGTPNVQLDASLNTFTNRSNATFTDGDAVSLSEVQELTPGPHIPALWAVLPA